MDYIEFKFKEYVETLIKNLPMEEKEIMLNNMSTIIPSIKNEIFKGYILCPYCKKYSKEDDFKIECYDKIIKEPTYIDAGYGDDDRIGDVKYKWFDKICPICQNHIFHNKIFMEILNEYDRWGNKIS